MSRQQRERKPSAKLADNFGEETGPVLKIIFTEEESNGKRLNLSLPFSTLKPTNHTGELVPLENLKEMEKYNFFYPHLKQYYPALLIEIKGRKKRRLSKEQNDDNPESSKTNPTEITKEKENQSKKAKANTSNLLAQEILAKDAAINLDINDKLLTEYVDIDDVQEKAKNMDSFLDFNIQTTNRSQSIEHQTIDNDTSTKNNSVLKPKCQAEVPEENGIWFTPKTTKRINDQCTNMLKLPSPVISEKGTDDSSTYYYLFMAENNDGEQQCSSQPSQSKRPRKTKKENQSKKAKANTSNLLAQEILAKDAAINLDINDKLLTEYVDIDDVQEKAKNMDSFLDFNIQTTNRSQSIEHQTIDNDTSTKNNSVLKPKCQAEVPEENGIWFTPKTTKRINDQCTNMLKLPSPVISEKGNHKMVQNC
ncbi:uncharacterized protein [Clytia hemisphaerica]|uniref:uncharacterized protein n=1 Tax=Clytia hemisphaerica TaxID=252671 RepID=UPI0034D4BE98